MSNPCRGVTCWLGSNGVWYHTLNDVMCIVSAVNGLSKDLPCFEDVIRFLLIHLGEKLDRGGLKDTPFRVARAWKEWCSGYNHNPDEVFKHFEDGAAKYDEMVIVRDIPFYSHCEHHLAPFFGTTSIAYIPTGRVLGISKLARLTDIFSRRLQVQERLTNQIADTLMEHAQLKPAGVGVLIKARHLCMESRGIKQQGHQTITSALRGAILEKPAARAEFLNLTGNGK